MLCPVLVGRDDELSLLRAALDRASDGAGSLVFVAGNAGLGKSRLVREVASLAVARGFEVLSGRAAESAVPVPVRPVAEALMKLARSGMVPDAPELAGYRPALAAVVPEWGRPGDKASELSPIILGEALLRLLALPGRAGTLLVLEDLHWADPETLGIVEYLADNLAGTRVLCVATLRDADPSAGLDLCRSLRARRAADCADLRRLTGAQLGQMAAACLGTEDLPGEVRDLLADSDGLPFAVEEILAAASSSGQLVQDHGRWRIDPQVAAGVPASIAGSVRSRVATLGPAVADVLAGAAVLGRTFDWALLPAVTGVPEPEVLAALQRAQGVQLIEPSGRASETFRFRHSLTRHAILSDLLAPDRSRRSARAAAAIERAHPDLPGAWCGLAAELHEAAGHPVRAVELLVETGRRDRRRGALDSALAALSKASRLAADIAADEPGLALAAGEELVKALALAGEHAELTRVADGLIAKMDSGDVDPDLKARILLMAARTESESDHQAAVGHLAAARAIADQFTDPMTAAGVDVVGARCAIDAGELDTASELAYRALASAESDKEHSWSSDIAIEALAIIGRRERARNLRAAREAFEQAYQIAADTSDAVRRITVLHELGTIDMLENGGTDRLSEAKELAQKAGAISTVAVIDLQLANVWGIGTDLDRAMAAARQSELGARRLEARQLEAMALSAQALICGIRADRPAALRAAERAELLMPGDPELLLTTWGQARVAASLFLDEIPRALQESLTAISYADHAAISSPRRAWGLNAILVAVSSENPCGAIERARAAGAAAAWNRGFLAYADAVLAGREGHRDRATALAAEGSSLLAPYAPWWNQLGRRLVAPAAFEHGWGRPGDWLREAAAGFDDSGHRRLASACRGLLRQAGERVPRSGRGSALVPAQLQRLGVTSREMDVFLLVARGLSNTEIATRLFISPKTVETHVASLVIKTGQAGRRELVAHAARFAPS